MKRFFLITVLLTISVFYIFSVNKEKNMTDAESNLDIVKMILKMYNSDPKLADKIFDVNCIHHINGTTEEGKGPDAIKNSLLLMSKQFSSSKTVFTEIISEGDSIAVRWTWEASGLQDQKIWKFNGNTVFHFKNGKIVEYWAIDDRFREMLKHGFTLTPPQK